ncbi:hypothetical protein E3N88_33165 [Mikania micrantha]|uniref:Uncharacterized protein n=1 Tax=Mikania micrantha TaxID=192012 RepID=A0A5N6MAH1_9ASTR|nr:hypothetical protein E3N88_33165 [Mikania micrantha]
MGEQSSAEVMLPWVGLYAALASLICIVVMAADAILAIWQWKLWFPNRFFTLNATTITLIAITMKLPVDLIALTVSATREKLEHRYMESRQLISNHEEKKFSSKELKLYVKKYWMMAETRNPQFVIACSSVSSALGVTCLFLAIFSANTSNSNVNSEIEEYARYVVQIEEDAKLSKRILRNTLLTINQLLDAQNEPCNLLMLLEKSKGFKGVVEFDNDNMVSPLYPDQTLNCWSLVVVTLTIIAIALPNIANDHLTGLLDAITEGLQIVRHIEDCLNTDGELVNEIKSARRVWKEVEAYRTWLHIDLQKMPCRGKTSKGILKWLGNEAEKIMKKFMSKRKPSIDQSPYKFILASSMYRISKTLLMHFKEQKNWLNDEELYERISTIIADVLLACFTNLPRVIRMKCHHNEIEKRGDSIRIAAQLLSKSKRILKILKAHPLPNIDQDSMAYVDKWRALRKSQILDDYASPWEAQPSSASGNESILNINLQ